MNFLKIYLFLYKRSDFFLNFFPAYFYAESQEPFRDNKEHLNTPSSFNSSDLDFESKKFFFYFLVDILTLGSRKPKYATDPDPNYCSGNTVANSAASFTTKTLCDQVKIDLKGLYK